MGQTSLTPDFDALMDVDQPASLPSSSSKCPATSPLIPSSVEKRAKLLPPAQLTMFNDNMKRASYVKLWQYRMERAAGDNSRWQSLLVDVMIYLTSELEATDMKGSVIACTFLTRALEMVKSFNNDVFEQWKAGVRDGVEKNCWKGLMEHRTNPLPAYFHLLNANPHLLLSNFARAVVIAT